MEVLSAGLDINRLTKEPVLLSDYFEKIKYSNTQRINDSKDFGQYPLYTGSTEKHIQGYVDKMSYDNINDDILLVITLFGNVYKIQHQQFAIQSDGNIFVVKILNKNINIDINIKLLNIQLSNYIQSYSKLTWNKIKDFKVYLYI